MYCTDCGSRNPQESNYCRECGRKILSFEDEARLAPSRTSKLLNIEMTEPPAEPDKLRLLLDMAFWHNEVGNVSGAILACEAALKVDPYSTSALSLLGCLYEKQGKDDKAIEAFERVVQLNPDSIADAEKLENLLRGIRQKAVTPTLTYQLMPPLLLQAIRRYPALPFAGGLLVGLVLLVVGVGSIWSRMKPAPVQQYEPVSTVASLPGAMHAPAVSSQPVLQQSAGLPTPSTGVVPDPFIIQRQNELARAAAAQSQLAAANVVPKVQKQVSSPTPMPSVETIKPLAVPASIVPNHVVEVVQAQPENDHVVMVGEQPQENSVNDGSQSGDGDSLPAPPASHIYITVHGATASSNPNESTPTPSDNEGNAISLREDAGASLQQKGLTMQDAGNYKSAEAAYESAVAAYQQDIANGRDSDQAKRGIEACQVAIEICKQSQ